MKQEWVYKRLSDVCKKITDGSHNPPKSNEACDFMMLSSKNIFDDLIHFEDPRYLTQKDFESENKRTEIQIGDVLLTIVGTIGRVAVVPKDFPRFTLQRSVAVLKPKRDALDSRFLMYSLQNKLEFLTNEARGVAQKGIYLNQIKNIEIPLPSLPEQLCIVRLLDEAFASIAKAKANAEQNLKNAKELFESYLQNIFKNKGEDWQEKNLDQISVNLDSKRVPITQNVRKKGSIPYYGASGIVDYVEEYLFDDDLLLVSEDGANLLARTYPIAFSIKGKSWVNNHAHILKFKNMASQKFVEYYLNSIKLDDYVSGMAQPKLNQKMLNSILIPFPTEVQQQAIVKRLNYFLSETKKLEAIYQQKLNDLAELKRSLLQKAFKGELKTEKALVE